MGLVARVPQEGCRGRVLAHSRLGEHLQSSPATGRATLGGPKGTALPEKPPCSDSPGAAGGLLAPDLAQKGVVIPSPGGTSSLESSRIPRWCSLGGGT